MKDFGKTYSCYEELLKRLHIFLENFIKIEQKNREKTAGTATYGITKFTDLSKEEFIQQNCGYNNAAALRKGSTVPFAEIPNVELPLHFDWREKNAVTPIKDQQQCGSCWAFSAVGNIEGQYAIKYKNLTEFSEQEVMDCDTFDYSCSGGLMLEAFEAIQLFGGLQTEQDYPYKGVDDQCRMNSSKQIAKVTGEVRISGDEEKMAKWLIENGPIAIAINAEDMQFYHSGIAHPAKDWCYSDRESLNHGVLIVGYGVDNATQVPYWIIKNSWGTDWGLEQGYYRIFRGDGSCGLNNYVCSAIVA